MKLSAKRQARNRGRPCVSRGFLYLLIKAKNFAILSYRLTVPAPTFVRLKGDYMITASVFSREEVRRDKPRTVYMIGDHLSEALSEQAFKEKLDHGELLVIVHGGELGPSYLIVDVAIIVTCPTHQPCNIQVLSEYINELCRTENISYRIAVHYVDAEDDATGP
jgi:hypothetical protein